MDTKTAGKLLKISLSLIIIIWTLSSTNVIRVTHGVTVIILGSRLGYLSSKPEQGCLHVTVLITLEKVLI